MGAAPCRPHLLHRSLISQQRSMCRGRPLGMQDDVEVPVISVLLSAMYSTIVNIYPRPNAFAIPAAAAVQ